MAKKIVTLNINKESPAGICEIDVEIGLNLRSNLSGVITSTWIQEYKFFDEWFQILFSTLERSVNNSQEIVFVESLKLWGLQEYIKYFR